MNARSETNATMPCRRAPAPTLLWVGLLALLCSSTWSCRRKVETDCPLFEIHLVEPTPKTIVARVDGHPVGLTDVENIMKEKGLGPRQALQEAVDCKLLELEALRLGLDRHPDVILAAKAAAARKLIKTVFEPSFTKKDIPLSALKRAYQLNIRRFQHPELRRFSHVLVKLPWKRKRRKRFIYRNEVLGAKKLAHEFNAIAMEAAKKKKISSWRDFEALADRIRDRGFEITVERGTKAHADLRKSFADELFGLKKPGDISKVVRTVYGYHVIFLVEIIPAKHVGFEEAKPEIIKHVFPELRQDAFLRWVQALAKRCRVVSHPELIPIEGACHPKETQ